MLSVASFTFFPLQQASHTHHYPFIMEEVCKFPSRSFFIAVCRRKEVDHPLLDSRRDWRLRPDYVLGRHVRLLYKFNILDRCCEEAEVDEKMSR